MIRWFARLRHERPYEVSDNQGRCQASGQVKIQDDLGSGHYLPGTVLSSLLKTITHHNNMIRLSGFCILVNINLAIYCVSDPLVIVCIALIN